MASRRINVLVYSGTGASPSALHHTLSTLRSLLQPYYAVLPIATSTLLSEPWQSTCALLVFPGGGDLGYCRALNGAGNRRIKQYVANGGAYLGFCAGGYYGSRKCEFEVGSKEMEVVGERELSFFPGVCRGGAFEGFEYGSERGTRAVDLVVRTELFANAHSSAPERFLSYFNGGGVFVDAAKFADQGVGVLAEYTAKLDVNGGASAAAIVYCKVEKGAAILTGPHPEFTASHMSPHATGLDPQVIPALQSDEADRTLFMQGCLQKLGLQTVAKQEEKPSLSAIHLSTNNPSVHLNTICQHWIDASKRIEGSHYLECEQDIFDIQLLSDSDSKWSLAKTTRALLDAVENVHVAGTDGEEDEGLGGSTNQAEEAPLLPGVTNYEDNVKTIVIHNGPLPPRESTPQFDHEAYYAALAQCESVSRDTFDHNAINFGGTLLYGETVTSTSTLLEKNPILTQSLPPGTTLTATHQLTARGRGSNIWLSPPGCLMFSTLFSHPLSLNTSAPLVFVQYIAAIAVAVGVRTYDEGDARYAAVGSGVRLKWPNDVYALRPEAMSQRTTATKSRGPVNDTQTQGGLDEYTKIGGILVNTAYAPGSPDESGPDASPPSYKIVLGIGLNLANALPTTSLNALVDAYNASDTSTFNGNSTVPLAHYVPERLLARILTTFSLLYGRFRRQGWVGSGLEKLYEDLWLHADAIVTLEEEGGVKARVKGVTRDWGMLRAEEVGGDGRSKGREFALQSDGNSFDFLRGLVRRKL